MLPSFFLWLYSYLMIFDTKVYALFSYLALQRKTIVLLISVHHSLWPSQYVKISFCMNLNVLRLEGDLNNTVSEWVGFTWSRFLWTVLTSSWRLHPWTPNRWLPSNNSHGICHSTSSLWRWRMGACACLLERIWLKQIIDYVLKIKIQNNDNLQGGDAFLSLLVPLPTAAFSKSMLPNAFD